MNQLLDFAQEHNLKIISIADLIAYRQNRERLIVRAEEFAIHTVAGDAHAVTYRTQFDSIEHLALDCVEVRRRINNLRRCFKILRLRCRFW